MYATSPISAMTLPMIFKARSRQEPPKRIVVHGLVIGGWLGMLQPVRSSGSQRLIDAR